MTKLTLPRAAAQVVALLCCCLLAWASPASAFTAANTKKGTGEQTPLNLGPPSTGTHTSSGGASIVRTIVGLAIKRHRRVRVVSVLGVPRGTGGRWAAFKGACLATPTQRAC